MSYSIPGNLIPTLTKKLQVPPKAEIIKVNQTNEPSISLQYWNIYFVLDSPQRLE